MVVLVAAIGAHVEKLRSRPQSDAAMAILAYVAARAMTGGLTHPGSLDSWSPYPVSHWLQYADLLLVGAFLQALILRPIWPVLVRDAGEIRRWAAVILCVLPFLLWSRLSGIVGSASAALICALALVVAMMLAGRHRFVLLALVFCAGFLAVSALVQHGPPPGVLGTFNFNAPDVDFRIALPAAADDTSGLSLTVNVNPPAPTLFQCPARVDVSIFLNVAQSANQKDMPQSNKLIADLARSPYTLDVSGVTRVTDLKRTANGSSRVIYAPASQGGTHTEWHATGFDTTAGLGDILDFSLPLQSWRSMGTCYVTIPQVNQDILWAGTKYFSQPASAMVSLRPETGTSVDLADTSPQPDNQPLVTGTYDWTCFDYSHPRSEGITRQCPAIAVMAAGWSASYPQVTLLVVGALIAIAAERWFGAILPEEPGKQQKATDHSGDDKDADPPPGDGAQLTMDVVAPDSRRP